MPTVDFDVTLGETYYIAVDGLDGLAASFSVSLSDNSSNEGDFPEGAVGMLDFRNGVYKWGEDVYTATDVIDHPEYVIPGLGMYLQWYRLVSPFDDLPSCGLLDSPFLDHLLAGDFTIVEETYGDDYQQILYMDGSAAGEINVTYGTDNSILVNDKNQLREFELTETTDFGVPNYNITAFTRTTAHIAARVAEGEFAGTTYEDASPTAGALASTGAWIGGNDVALYGSMLVSRIVFYPATDNGDLADLIADPLLEPAPNDDFADAVALALDTPYNGHNYFGTAEGSEPDHGGVSSGNSVWFTFTPGSSGMRTATVSGPGDFNGWGPVVAVYTGAAVGSLSEVASASDWPGAAVSWSATSGVTYHIAVDAAGGLPANPGHSPFTIEVT